MSRNARMNTAAVGGIIADLETKVGSVKSIFKSLNTNMANVDGTTETWKGRSQEIIYKKYCEISNKYSSINEQLDAYITFLKDTLEAYKQEENNIQSSTANSESDLNVQM